MPHSTKKYLVRGLIRELQALDCPDALVVVQTGSTLRTNLRFELLQGSVLLIHAHKEKDVS